MNLETVWREEDGKRLASTVWRAGDGHRMISSAMLGGGIGPARWVLNAQVPGTYSRTDPVAHLAGLAASYGLDGPGAGMLTAASVARTMRRDDEGVAVSATVGLRVPTWAVSPAGTPDPELAPVDLDVTSSPDLDVTPPLDLDVTPPIDRDVTSPPGLDGTPSPGLNVMPSPELDGTSPPGLEMTSPPGLEIASSPDRDVPSPPDRDGAFPPGWAPGTVNIVVAVPVPMSDAALVNAVVTATEAKTQALLEAGFPCTGTASDAICVVATTGGTEEIFAGPRSAWGSRLARAVHAAVHAGAVDYAGHLKSLGR
ncbi:adenosylcobinamide amidohydrolase [Spirillospora sp. CA-128828]|uniref:adenosylcobinamide amidohydrolase n=1 Tax=Spirillospora sp. CA-128828 TaxID=3240033 RepID=UPI003D8B16D6